MFKQKLKLLEKIKEKGEMLFLGKADLEAIGCLSEKNQVKAVFTKINEKNLIDKIFKKEKLKTVFARSFNEIKEKFDFSVVFHEDFFGAEKTTELLETAGKKTRLNGKIYFFCKTSRGAKSFQKKMKEIFGNVKVVSVKGGLRLIVSVKKRKIQKKKTKEKKLIEFSLRNNKYFFESSFGIFSKNKIDDGTKLLLENLGNLKEKKILDFGCGTGVIGIVIGKENSEKKVVLIDSNAKAVELTQKNIKLNKINNAKAIVSDGFSSVKENFDLIASNPPTHEKREFLEKFVFESEKKLNKQGKFIIVLNKAVFLEKELNEVFGNYKILAQGKEHKVIESAKK